MAAQTEGRQLGDESYETAGERGGSGAVVFGRNIFINARYLNINGLIRSGRPNREVTIDPDRQIANPDYDPWLAWAYRILGWDYSEEPYVTLGEKFARMEYFILTAADKEIVMKALDGGCGKVPNLVIAACTNFILSALPSAP